jgi:hypothetical protein
MRLGGRWQRRGKIGPKFHDFAFETSEEITRRTAGDVLAPEAFPSVTIPAADILLD